jgi:AraC-like DNA-binding protein
MDAAWEVAGVLAGPQVGLLAARELHLGDVDPHAQLLDATRTLGDAFELAIQYHRLICDYMAITAEAAPRNALLRFRTLSSSDLADSQVEFAVAAFCRLFGFVFGSLPIAEVRFRHLSRSPLCLLDATFGCPVTLGADETALVIPGGALELPNGLADLRVGAARPEDAGHAIRLPPAMPPLSGQVYDRLVNALPLRVTGADDIARDLQMSERTLRRRLLGEGTSHRHLLEHARRAVAIRLLGEHRSSVDEVAYHLGYAQASSFQRAFKRWTGLPPATYRVRCGRAITLPPPLD